MNKDLTTGKPEKVLWQFCLPLFGSIIFQQLSIKKFGDSRTSIELKTLFDSKEIPLP